MFSFLYYMSTYVQIEPVWMIDQPIIDIYHLI